MENSCHLGVRNFKYSEVGKKTSFFPLLVIALGATPFFSLLSHQSIHLLIWHRAFRQRRVRA
jgi:hypothetical protein